MQTSDVGLIGLLVLLILIASAIFNWIAKSRNQSSELPIPQPLVNTVLGQKAMYVATTFADRPLERVIAHGLAHRGFALVGVSDEGVSVSRTGESSFLIPTQSLLHLGKTTAVIDRVVEQDGLTSIRWKLGTAEVETHFRFISSSGRDAFVYALKTLAGV